MQELRVLLETKQPINDEIRSAWFLLPIDEEELQERLGVDPAFASIEERLARYFDFEAYGQYLDDNGRFLETEHGIYEIP